MELQGITGTILLEAKESAELIIDDAKKLAEKMVKKQKHLGTKEANEKRLSILKKAANEADMERLHKIANSKITSDWIVLARKEEIIRSVIEEAKIRLRNFTKTKEYIPIIENMIMEAGTILGSNNIEVILNKDDTKLPLDLKKLSEKIRLRTGNKVKLKISDEKNNAIGGVLVRPSDKKILMDNTFDDLFKQKEKIIKNKISELLF